MKVAKEKQFIEVYADILRDANLTMQDRGLLMTLFALPDDFNFSIRAMTKILPEGKDAIANSVSRLEDMGYIARVQLRNEDGSFGHNVLGVYEVPTNTKPNYV